jgi:Na+-transporting NADH:ubiquinone oxidoreductase subunit D
MKRTFIDPLVERNPILWRALGMCPALAVTTRLENAIAMTAALAAVLGFSALAISAMRRFIPDSIRIIVHLIIIASLVIVADQFLRTYFVEISRQLSVYVALIATNCVILGRVESFAMQHNPLRSVVDAAGNAAGYGAALCATAIVRELAGTGNVLGFSLLPLATRDGWFVPAGVMITPAGAFFVFGILVWLVRSWKREQIEEE